MSLLFILFVCQFVCQLVNTNNLSYSLYWSGYTSYSNFSGLNNGSFLPIWEASPFTIQVNQGYNNIRLRYVSIIFRRSMNNEEYLIYGGRRSLTLCDRRDGRMMLNSHCQLYSRKNNSFWAEEYTQRNNACPNKDGSHMYPGCLNLLYENDNSSISIYFPTGHASYPYGKYTDGIMSVLLKKFDPNWNPKMDFDSPHQNFVLLIIPRQLSFIVDSYGEIKSYPWEKIEAETLRNPLNVDILSIKNSSEYNLLIDSEKPFKIISNESCPINYPQSENDALISRHKHLVLNLNNISSKIMSFTSSIPCPLWKQSSPYIKWLKDGKSLNENISITKTCDDKSIDGFNISTGYYTENITLNVSINKRIEYRAFLTEIPEIPCCTNENHKSLCQPDTGITRVILDITNNIPVNIVNISDYISPINDTCIDVTQFCGKKTIYPVNYPTDIQNQKLKVDSSKKTILIIAGNVSCYIIIIFIVIIILFMIICLKKKNIPLGNLTERIPLASTV